MIQSGFKELLDEFLLEAQERASEVESLLLQLAAGDLGVRKESLARAKRELHTLKGNSGMMGFSDLQQLTHQMEDRVESLDLEDPSIDELLAELDQLRVGLEEVSRAGEEEMGAGDLDAGRAAAEEEVTPGAELRLSSVRVPFSDIDRLVEMQAESLIYRNRLAEAVGHGQALLKRGDHDDREAALVAWEDVREAQQSLEKILNQLQERVTQLSMVPLQGLFRSLRRIVHDESSRAGKNVELVIEGGETPIDKTLLEAAGEALGHLVRNAVIHGIESPEERRQARKPEVGRIGVAATIDANEVRIAITDDGGGIDLEALRRNAGRVLGGELESDFALLFEEGVSTRQDADLSAGRGVGLTAVKKSVESHGGRIAVESHRGLGTSFVLRLPITASILRSLTIRADGEEYALPLTAVTETLLTRSEDRHEIHRSGVLRWRGRVVPLLDLGLTFGTAERARDDGFIVVVEVHGRYRALAADEIVGIRDIVVKGLDPIVGRPAGVAGSTILGDGRVIMILDPTALASMPPSSLMAS